VRDWNIVDFRRMIAQALFPPLKVNRAAERRQHHKLGKGNPGSGIVEALNSESN
jgi:hypothetical protein